MAELIHTAQVGAREDLADLIAIADMKATPFLTAAKKSAAPTNPLFSWLVDGLDNARRTGVLGNEDAATFENKAANRKRLYGRIQKLWRLPKVSDIAENVSDTAGLGVKAEMRAAIARSMKEIARDIEATLCSDQDSREESGSDANLTRGLGSWINNSAQSDLAVDSAYRTPAASVTTTATGSMTDTVVQGILQSIYTQTGVRKRLTALCGPTHKRAYTAMTQVQFGSTNVASAVRVYNAELAAGIVGASVDVFIGDFGELELVPSMFLRTDVSAAAGLCSAFYVDMDGVSIRYNRRPRYKPLEDNGGGPRGIIDAIVGLQVDSPLQHGAIKAAS
jgi:hypothetical protein